jgi:hypothetical protein
MVEKRELHTGFWWGLIEKRDHLKDLDVDGMIILNLVLNKWREEISNECV